MMLGKPTLLGSLALGLIAGVSSSSLGPVSHNDNAAGSVLGAAFNDAASPAVASSSAAAGLNLPRQDDNVKAVAVSQVSSPALAGFTTVVVSACTLGISAPAPTGTVDSQATSVLAASSSSTSAPYAGATLLPAVHWDYPVGDIRNLAPSNSSELYYSAGGVSDPAVQHLFASLSTTLSYDSVVLDHSTFVSSTTCSTDGILVTFTSTEAFSFAADSWSAVGPFVLVTYTDGCHGDSNDQRTFWLINSVQLQNATNSILAVVQEEIAIEDAIYGVDMIWGTWNPSTNSTNSTGSGSTNSTSSNGSSCGAAPSSIVDGLPAVACGDANFDADLDSALGYLDFSSADYASSIDDFAPGINFTSEDLDDDQTQLQGRGFFWGGPKAIVQVDLTYS